MKNGCCLSFVPALCRVCYVRSILSSQPEQFLYSPYNPRLSVGLPYVPPFLHSLDFFEDIQVVPRDHNIERLFQHKAHPSKQHRHQKQEPSNGDPEIEPDHGFGGADSGVLRSVHMDHPPRPRVHPDFDRVSAEIRCVYILHVTHRSCIMSQTVCVLGHDIYSDLRYYLRVGELMHEVRHRPIVARFCPGYASCCTHHCGLCWYRAEKVYNLPDIHLCRCCV